MDLTDGEKGKPESKEQADIGIMKVFKTKEAKIGFSKLLYDTAKIIFVIMFLQPIMHLKINFFILTISSLLFILLISLAFYLDNKETT